MFALASTFACGSEGIQQVLERLPDEVDGAVPWFEKALGSTIAKIVDVCDTFEDTEVELNPTAPARSFDMQYGWRRISDQSRRAVLHTQHGYEEVTNRSWQCGAVFRWLMNDGCGGE